jgi:chorismate mutase/prephenate dehydratase
MAEPPRDLDELRRDIDAVDDEILALLNRRARLVRSVAAWKEAHARPFYVPERERAVVERLTAQNAGPFPSDGIRPVFAEIMSACLSLEQRLRVAYLGPEATFTHQASRTRFGLSARYLPAATIAGVFAEVEKGAADLGVVPVENSTEGVVSHTLDVFMDSDLAIHQEIVLEVSHCLLTRAGSLADVKKVFSHPQALAQCRAWLAGNLPGAATIEVASTALAARLAGDDAQAAAVASELAAQLYDLPVARRKIEDERVNITRFLVVGPPPKDGGAEGPVSGPPSPSGEPPPIGDGGSFKTSLMFTLRDQPGGLHRALAPFAAHGVNLTRIESRPSRRRAWDYAFFIDLDGHVAEPRVAAALAEFRPGCELVKVLGCYVRAPSGAEAG